MSGQTRPLTAGIESTYKAREVEGILDLYFYRKLGFQLARLAAALRLTPSAVTGIGGLLGILAGHLYYYADIRLNLAGMVLHVGANLFDNADGQLARLTQSQSRAGRILDGCVDHLVWLSIYAHLILRVSSTGSLGVSLVLGVFAALSHGWQGAAADYYRTSYLHFLKGSPAGQLDEFGVIQNEYRNTSWANPWSKLLLLLHRNYTRQQEIAAPRLHRLRQVMAEQTAVVPRFLVESKVAFRWWGLLMTNTRMLILFAALLLGRPGGFFWIEATLFNVFLIVLLIRQERMSSQLLRASCSAGEVTP